jgi:hypothetical protein
MCLSVVVTVERRQRQRGSARYYFVEKDKPFLLVVE